MRKLYYSPNSPLSRKVRVVLYEKGLPFDEDAQKEHRDPSTFRSVNPILRVPVLEDGGIRLFESDLIIEYLLEKYPHNEMTDEAPLSAALFRDGMVKWTDKETIAILNAFGDAVANLLFIERDGGNRADIPYLQRQEIRVQACLDWLEDRATPDGFIPGELSVQDISLVCWWEWLKVRGVIDMGARPTLEKIVSLHSERPSFRSTRPE